MKNKTKFVHICYCTSSFLWLKPVGSLANRQKLDTAASYSLNNKYKYITNFQRRLQTKTLEDITQLDYWRIEIVYGDNVKLSRHVEHRQWSQETISWLPEMGSHQWRVALLVYLHGPTATRANAQTSKQAWRTNR